MASAYDMITVKGTPRYRMDRQFIKKDLVPGLVLDVLTPENIVDENGNIIVDQKNETANQVEETKTDTGEEDGKTPEPLENGSPYPEPVTGEAISQDSNPIPASDVVIPPAPETVISEPIQADITLAPVGSDPTLPKEVEQDSDSTGSKFVSKVPQSSPGMGFPRKDGKTVDIFDMTTPHTHVKLVGGYAVPLSNENYKTKNDGQIERRLREMGYEVIDFTGNVDANALTGDVENVRDDDSDDGLSEDR